MGVSQAIFAAVTEEKPESRPKCGFKITEKHASGGTSEKLCGSEDGLKMVKGHGRYSGRDRETPVCEKHVLKAWGDWNVDSIEPIR